MIKASKLAIAIAVIGPLAIASMAETFAAPGAVTVKTAAPAAATDVQYRAYGYGPYAYAPAYLYGGYTYGYPGYWEPYTWNTGNGYY